MPAHHRNRGHKWIHCFHISETVYTRSGDFFNNHACVVCTVNRVYTAHGRRWFTLYTRTVWFTLLPLSYNVKITIYSFNMPQTFCCLPRYALWFAVHFYIHEFRFDKIFEKQFKSNMTIPECSETFCWRILPLGIVH